jgi:hypothetical protein
MVLAVGAGTAVAVLLAIVLATAVYLGLAFAAILALARALRYATTPSPPDLVLLDAFRQARAARHGRGGRVGPPPDRLAS